MATDINRDILRLSLPAIISNVTVPLLGICDTAVSGHLGSEVYLAAIAVGSMMLNVVFWLFGFLRMGTTGLTATAYGRGDTAGETKVFTRAFFLALLIGALLISSRGVLMDVLMRVIDAEADVNGYVERYFTICIWEAPAMLGVMAVSGWFVGMQSTVYPMVIAISVNVINILLSVSLVFLFKMGFVGVAYGTLAANWLGLCIALICVVRFRGGWQIFCGLRTMMKGGGMLKFFSVSGNLFFRSACIIGVSLGVTAAGARLGATTLAVNAVLMQFFTFFSFFMDGFAFSGEALTGKWTGAGNVEMLRRSVAHLLVWTLGVALLFSILYGTGCNLAAGMLTDEESVRSGVREMRIWITLLPMLSAWAFIYDGFFVGITDTAKMLLSTLIAAAVFFAIAFLHFSGGSIRVGVNGNMALWTAFLGYLSIRGMVLALAWPASWRRAMVKN